MADKKIEQVAVVRNPRFGVIDRGYVALTFDAYISESDAALQVLGVEAAVKALEDTGVSDVSRLEGRACWVEMGDDTIIFKRMWKR